MKITRYEDAFDLIGINIGDRVKRFIKLLENEGYNERGICYAIWKSQNKIMQYKGDTRLLSILANEVRKYAFRRR